MMDWKKRPTHRKAEDIRARSSRTARSIADELGVSRGLIYWVAKQHDIKLKADHAPAKTALTVDDDPTDVWAMNENDRRAYFARRASEGARETLRAAQ